MMNKDYLTKVYKSFYDFVAVAAAKELEYFILDSKFTSAFNYRMKKIVEDINKDGAIGTDIFVMFNTNSEIVIIDAQVLGAYIADVYSEKMKTYYKGAELNKVIRDTVNNNEKIQRDFLTISYKIVYNALNEIYMDIKYRKEVLDRFKAYYGIENEDRKDMPLIILTLLIIEDVFKYMGIDKNCFVNIIKESLQKRV